MRTRTRLVLLMTVLALLQLIVSARVALTGPVIAWVHQFGTPAHDEAFGVESKGGHLYVTGATEGTLGGQANLGGFDGYLAKYDANGSQVWVAQFGTSGDDYSIGIAVDSSGIYVSGHTMGAFDGFTAAGDQDAFLLKFSASGEQRWVRQYGTAGWDAIIRLATFGGSVFAAGWVEGELNGQSQVGGRDSVVRRYEADGTRRWTRQFGTADQDYAYGIDADSSGVYVAGSAVGAFPGYSSKGGLDAFVRRFGLKGRARWTRQFGSEGTDFPSDVSLDTSGVYVVGVTSGALPGQTLGGSDDGFVRKFGREANVRWTRQFGGGGSEDPQGSIADGVSLYIAGMAGTGESDSADGFVKQMSPAGDAGTVTSFGTLGANDTAFGPALLGESLYSAGTTGGTFEGQFSSGSFDAYVLELAP